MMSRCCAVLRAAAAATLCFHGCVEVKGADELLRRSLTSEDSRRLTDPGCGVDDVPQGWSQRYDQVWVYQGLDFDYQALYGYDTSDPRYRFPDDHHVEDRYKGLKPGGVATEICSADQNGAITCPLPTGGWLDHTIDSQHVGAKLYLASEHVARQDLKYLNCLKIEKFVDMTAPRFYTEDNYPISSGHPVHYPTYGRAAFTIYNQSFPAADTINFPHDFWLTYKSQAEAEIDQWLADGKSVLIYDEEGSKGAAALAMSYMLSKNPSATFLAAYTALTVARPWVSDLDDYPDWKTELRKINDLTR